MSRWGTGLRASLLTRSGMRDPSCCPVRDLRAQVLNPVPIGLNCGNTLEGLSGATQGGSGVASKSADTMGTRIGRMDDEQPVTLVASRFEEWADHYARFAAAILEVLPEARCEHIGSTSVPDLPAKDVIDVIVGVRVSSVQNAARALKMAGFDLEGMKPGHAGSRGQAAAIGNPWCTSSHSKALNGLHASHSATCLEKIRRPAPNTLRPRRPQPTQPWAGVTTRLPNTPPSRAF